MMRYSSERPSYEQADYWVKPSGKEDRIPLNATHDEWARAKHGKSGYTLLDDGWLRVSGDSIMLDSSSLTSSKALDKAVELASKNGGKEGRIYIELSDEGALDEFLLLKLENKGEFLESPRAFFMRNKLDRPTITSLSAFEHPTETAAGTPIPRQMGEAPSSMGFTERPRANRLVTPFELDNPLAAASILAPGEGRKPTITYLDKFLAPKHIYHENMHGGLAYTGLSNFTESLMRDSSMGKQLFSFMTPNVRAMYEKHGVLGEETWTYLAQAIRLENRGEKYLLDAFVEADESREKVFEFANDVATKLFDRVAEKSPSVQKSALQRNLRDLMRRTGGLQDLGREAEAVGELVSVEDGKFIVTRDADRHVFASRSEAEAFIEKNFREPLNAPELVDSTHLPEGIPRYSAEMPTNRRRPPKTADPLPNELATREPIKGGGFAFSRFFRPFYPWVDDVAKKFGRPELYSSFDKLRSDSLEMERAYAAATHKVEKAFKEAGTNVNATSYKKRVDLATYMRAPSEKKVEVAAQLNMTPQDLKVAEKLRELYNWGYTDVGVKAPYVDDYVMRFTPDNFDPEALRRTGKYTQGDIDFIANHVRSEEFDLADRDIVSNMATYFRLGYKWKFMRESLKEAAKIVDERNEKGEWVWGNLRPLLKRHLDYHRGVPDYTQSMINGALEQAKGLYNAGVQKVNEHLPDSLKMEEMTLPAQDILSKYVLFSYAGGLGLRPMAFVRDSLQLLTTTLGVLGPKYMVVGMERALRNPEAWSLAEKYGWLLKENPLHSLTQGGYEKYTPGRVTQVAETVLRPLRWSNNSNRLVSGWGHFEKALDAIKEFSQTDTRQMAKKIGLHYLDEGLQKRYMSEIAQATPSQWEDISMRIAKDMVDFSQWSYRRGSAPGMYEYALGRLFGQYGTWPLNYIEFLRHVASRGDAADKVKALSQLALAHYAILSAGESVGVDTGTWVGLEPAAYSGGPLLQGVQALPSAASVETPQGRDARRTLRRLIIPGPIPGGLAAERVFKAVATDSEDLWKVLLGFQPMRAGEEKRGLHDMIP